MKPDRYELSPAGRQRLSGNLQRRGWKLGMSSVGGFLFGSVFVAVGVFVVLMGTKTLHVDPAFVHAPYWVLTVVGAVFATAGLMVWGMAWNQFSANRERRRAAERYPDEPALADYRWHPEGFEVSGWRRAAKAWAIAIGLTMFLSIFNWWAFCSDGGWIVIAVVTVFDLIAAALWYQAVRQLACAFKFGRSRITFTSFPYLLEAPVVIRWRPTDRISQINKGTFTLRCVEEWMEASGKNRSVTLVHEELWSARWSFDRPRKLQFKDPVELRYELPPGAQPTCLSSEKPLFWELEAKLDLPGLDFQETYLVPIYGTSVAQKVIATLATAPETLLSNLASPNPCAAPPRPVPLLTRLQVLFGGPINQFGWLIFGFGMIFFWLFVCRADLTSWYRFKAPLQTLQGRVTASSDTGASEGGTKNRRGTPIYRNEYAFTLGEKEYQAVSYATGRESQPGRNVTVEYVPGKPAIARIQGMRTNVFGPAVSFVVLFPLLGLGAVVYGLARGLSACRLLVHGIPASARLRDKRATNMSVNRRTVYEYSFVFKALHGEICTASTRSAADRFADGAEAHLLYDPLKPQRALLLDNLPGNTDIGDGGHLAMRWPALALASLVLPFAVILGHGYWALRLLTH